LTIPADHAIDLRPAGHATVRARDAVVDAMRGIAILMVIGIHALRAPAASAWATAVDAALRPCVPVFLFTAGYLTAKSGTVPLARRLRAVLAPYGLAFVAAYAYLALHNPAMDHRPLVALARFGFGYVFVYYFVFVYVGCTIALWIVFRLAPPDLRRSELVLLLSAAIGLGLLAGAYLAPLLARLGLSDAALIEEARMRDIPFWFSFSALGALVGLFAVAPALARLRGPLVGMAVVAYAAYALVRVFEIGDAADYDSVAFFAYAALLCLSLLALAPDSGFFAFIGMGSYFFYLWHIFIVMLLRDDTPLGSADLPLRALATYAVTLASCLVVLVALRRLDSPALSRWLGA
jgi:surface polysaccharide O-acyltransferase-like enzyme